MDFFEKIFKGHIEIYYGADSCFDGMTQFCWNEPFEGDLLIPLRFFQAALS
jgi:hypothetical protein